MKFRTSSVVAWRLGKTTDALSLPIYISPKVILSSEGILKFWICRSFIWYTVLPIVIIFAKEKNEEESEENKLLKQESDKKIIPVKKEVKIVTNFKNKKSNLLISKKVEKNNNSKCKTTYDLLDKKYKEDVFNLKVKYYFDMNNSEKRASAIYKYDRLEDILSSKPSKKNLELLLLMLVGDMSVDIQKDYPQEYSKIMKRIETKRDELKNNTTL